MCKTAGQYLSTKLSRSCNYHIMVITVVQLTTKPVYIHVCSTPRLYTVSLVHAFVADYGICGKNYLSEFYVAVNLDIPRRLNDVSNTCLISAYKGILPIAEVLNLQRLRFI